MSDTIYVYSTDTVWGIGGSIHSQEVLLSISKIKNTDPKKPISILFSSIDEIFQFINLGPFFSADWLRECFKLEVTLGLPKSWWKDQDTLSIFGASEFVAIRCLEFEHIKKICVKEKGPIFSTSLNISGEQPIINVQDAQNFFRKYISNGFKNTEFVEKQENLSGHSSSIIFYEECSFRIIRPGKLIDNVRKHLEILSTRIL